MRSQAPKDTRDTAFALENLKSTKRRGTCKQKQCQRRDGNRLASVRNIALLPKAQGSRDFTDEGDFRGPPVLQCPCGASEPWELGPHMVSTWSSVPLGCGNRSSWTEGLEQSGSGGSPSVDAAPRASDTGGDDSRGRVLCFEAGRRQTKLQTSPPTGTNAFVTLNNGSVNTFYI